jgi:hypothetical protein
MALYGNPNMPPASFKGSKKPDGVMVWNHQLPLTMGGIVGELPSGETLMRFGRVVSVLPASPRAFLLGNPSTSILKGVTFFSEGKAQNDPAQNEGHFEGEATEVVYFGAMQLATWDLTFAGAVAPTENSLVVFSTVTGRIGFMAAGATPPANYAKLNACVIQTAVANGVTIFIGSTGTIAA